MGRLKDKPHSAPPVAILESVKNLAIYSPIFSPSIFALSPHYQPNTIPRSNSLLKAPAAGKAICVAFGAPQKVIIGPRIGPSTGLPPGAPIGVLPVGS